MLSKGAKQGTLFQISLEQLLDKRNSLYILTHEIDWDRFEQEFDALYCHTNGRPAKPIRLMVGLHYLKYTYNLSDEEVVARWVENPYWQYFCGEKYFQFKMPLDPTSMTRWRNRVEDNGLSVLLQETIRAGLLMKAVRKSSIENTNVDTTVQENNITFPTDTKIAYKLICQLVKLAQSCGIDLRQSFTRSAKKSKIMQTRHRKARRSIEANKEVEKMKTYLSKLVHDIRRKAPMTLRKAPEYQQLMELSLRFLNQDKNSKNKLYSVHEPHVECIAKGKSHKKYEFGCKVAITATSKECFILSALAFHGNPYDGHTLKASLEDAKRNIAGLGKIKRAFADQGYQGHNYESKDILVKIVKKGWRKTIGSMRKWLSRRSAIEPVIGHLKSDCRLSRNFLKGKSGDMANAILSAAGFNMRKLLAHIFYAFFKILQNYENPCKVDYKMMSC